MRKISFGIFVAIMAVAVSTLTTNATNKKRDHETVVFLGTNQWMLVDPQDEGMTWDCFSGGTKCRGILEPNAVANAFGYYNDVDVFSWISNSHYEAIP
jgi:hypothetical protein